MPDDVLRLRATVVSEEALANIRAIGREIGAVPVRAGKGVQQVDSSFSALGKTIKGVGSELKSAVPSLGAFGLGAAGVGVAARTLTGTLGDISSKIVQMKYASKELGLSEQALRAFTSEAQKAGMAPEAMMAGLAGFKSNVDDFKMRIGSLRGELYAMGAGDFVNRVKNSTDMLDALKQAFSFKGALDKEDPSGEKGRRFFDKIQLGAGVARLSWEQFYETYKTKKVFTDDEIATAVKFNGMLVDMGENFDLLKAKIGVRIMPMIGRDLEDIDKIISGLTWIDNWIDKTAGKGDGGKGAASDPMGAAVGWINRLTGMDKWDPFGWKAQSGDLPPSAPPPPTLQEKRAARRARGFSPISFGGFGDDGGESSGASRIVQTGVYDALVEFSGGSRGSLGGGNGFTNASYSPGGTGDNTPIGRAFRAASTGGTGPSGTGPSGPPGTTTGNPNGQGVGGGSQGGPAGITAPAGTAIARSGLATVTSPSGKKFQVDERFAQNFQGFINDYEGAGGTLGSATGTLGSRPHNASGHPIGAAIDINQVGRGIRGGTGRSLAPGMEDELAEKWGLVSGNKWKSNDQGHFGIRSAEAAREALIKNSGGTAPNGQQTPFMKARAAAVAAGIKDPDTAAATAMHESGNMQRGKGGIFDRSGGTNPFGQTGVGSQGFIIGADGQKHKVYGSLAEGFEDHAKRWGGRYGDTPEETMRNLVKGGYNSTDPSWAATILKTRQREMNRINGAIRPPSVNGNVNVTVNSNGTKADAKVNEAGDLYQGTTVRQHKQMQRTEDAGETLSI
jgi:hypothetical protein